jgi:hypothetical protein
MPRLNANSSIKNTVSGAAAPNTRCRRAGRSPSRSKLAAWVAAAGRTQGAGRSQAHHIREAAAGHIRAAAHSQEAAAGRSQAAAAHSQAVVAAEEVADPADTVRPPRWRTPVCPIRSRATGGLTSRLSLAESATWRSPKAPFRRIRLRTTDFASGGSASAPKAAAEKLGTRNANANANGELTGPDGSLRAEGCRRRKGGRAAGIFTCAKGRRPGER